MTVRPAALSASRAKDYQQCPLKFRFSVVDRIPQPPTVATIRGTLVHLVLEKLFDRPPAERTIQTAETLVVPSWDELCEERAEYLPVIEADSSVETLIAEAQQLLLSYFGLEQPSNLRPESCESFIETEIASGLRLRGIVDRIDRSPTGLLRVVDYKTGRAPSSRFVDEALFQMRFYALMLQYTDRLPTRMQLLYLKSGQVLTLDPEQSDMSNFEAELMALWEKIAADARSGNFAPKRGPLCNWCSYQPMCPLFGGNPEPPSAEGLQRLLSMRSDGQD